MSESVEIRKSMCRWCKGECGVLVHVSDDHLVRVEEDPGWPRKTWPGARACVRRRAAKDWFYHPDRVNFPQKRAGEKGEGKWQTISWEQAFDEIAEKLGKIKGNYGGEAIAMSSGTAFREEYFPYLRLLILLGSLNFASSGTVCFVPRSRVADTIVGMFPHYSVRPSTKCIVFMGIDPLIARPTTAKGVRDAIKQGAKLIVIDPRRTLAAAQADIWLQLRPGTDCALLMGMINVIINEELYDKEFVEKWCYGFDKLKERVEEYPLEKVEKITEVPASQIREAAIVYAQNRPGTCFEGMGVEHIRDVTQAIHAKWIMAALVGNIDVEGGEELVGPHPTILSPVELEPPAVIPPEQKKKQLGSDKFKFTGWPGADLVRENVEKAWGKPRPIFFIGHGASIYRAIVTGKPYPVRAMITTISNPMVTQANIKLVYKALKSLDLYVVIDPFMTPSAELADYVLPPASWLESPALWDFAGYGREMVSHEAVLPVSIPGEYDHKQGYEICRELGIRLGQEKYWPWKTLEEFYDAQLKPTGYTFKEYVAKTGGCEYKPLKWKKYEEVAFATPTGKVELYSTIFEKLGYDPLPSYHEPAETQLSAPELAREYPLTLLTGGRFQPMYHSEWFQIDSTRKRHPDPLVQIHPETARGLDIEDGDWVWIETKRGRIRQRAKLFDGIRPNVIHAEHGWWFPELPGEEPWLHGVWESNANVLTDDDPEIANELTGQYQLKTALCKVYKVKKY